MVILVGFSILVAAGFLVAFLWAVKSGQYDDKHTPAMRMLFDDKVPTKTQQNNQHQHKQTLKSDQDTNSESRSEVNHRKGSVVEKKREEENRYGS